MAGIAFVTEADVADARCLRDPSHVGDRDADQPVDGLDVVELERLDDQVDPSVSVAAVSTGVTVSCDESVVM